MKRWIVFFLWSLLYASTIFAQVSGGQVYPNTGPSASGGGGIPQDAFYITTSCSGKTNCLQWVDDDSTDNCGTATTAFLTKINAYAGNGQPQVIIEGSGLGKLYKLATAGCHLEFDIPTTIHLFGGLDCAQPATTANCIQFGPTQTNGSTGYTIPQTFKYQIDGGGTLTGGANLSNAGIEIEPQTVNSLITSLNFVNFGATNATVGSCTNYAVLYDYAVAEGTVSFNHWQVTDTGTGRCAFANPNGVTTGSNTVFFLGNVIGGQSATNTSGCSSVGIIDGGTLGLVEGNNIYAFGIDTLLEGFGHRIENNQYDSANCAASTINAAIQFGGTGSISSVSIQGNNVQIATSHTGSLIARQSGSSATIADWSIIGNQNTDPATSAEGIFPGSGGAAYNCANAVNAGTLCYVYGNTGMSGLVSCGTTTNTGWQVENLVAGCNTSGQTANLGATNLYTPAVTKSVLVYCQVILTTAAGTSSTLPQCSVTYTDLFSNTSQTILLTPVWAANTPGCTGSTTNTVGNSCAGQALIVPKTSVAVTYSTSNYASNAAATMQYQVFVRATTN